MKKYPNPIPLPQHVFDERENRLHHIVLATRIGIGIRSLLIGVLLLGFWHFRASVLLFDVMAMMLDVGSSWILIYSFRLASRPPDANHPLGHGRFEPLAALIFGVVVMTLGCVMSAGELKKIFEGAHTDSIRTSGWIIPFISMVVLEMSFRKLKKVAEKLKAPALLSEAFHFRMDSVSSLIALGTFVFMFFFPAYRDLVDHVGAVLIGVLIMYLGWLSIRENAAQLVDLSPSKEYFEVVTEAALKVSGVRATEKTKIQIYGPDAHVAIDVEVDPNLTVEEAHGIAQRVRMEIQRAWPSVQDVIVHIEPHYAGDH